ncbi:cytoplasmic protein [Citrobacter amalonaticus]|uniref:Cytoplasmic protein n=1 Tax=Citrobacter amalonaticus TaxID=35703 RepID=A0A2S4S450_CITAM|nr:winged helix-turn-helix transcriptional regulator [Citrobacter amalonaticus]POT60037.1 cytoplasmic protein [Citrobacter amalonaticus]POT78168.1 cytoplasmic protein [Citrobacter amalonaticus]POU68620.1 cytoplasmic protein [Citrobacter amalonaticus]POV08224.1 cytoplasmic protein [Citrobacter amalonaticus]
MDFNPVDNSNGEELPAFAFSQKTKYLSAQQTLFDALLPAGEPFSQPAHWVHQFSPDQENANIILLDKGIISICHSGSNLYMSTAFSPSVLGLIDGYGFYYNIPGRPQHYLYAETDCSGYFVPLNKFVETANTQELWHDVARTLAHRLLVMSAREQELVGVDSYLKVRALIIELWTYPKEYRMQINIVNFIQRRTALSRSRIMKFLSDLRIGGYISINRGKLESVLQKLPSAY